MKPQSNLIRKNSVTRTIEFMNQEAKKVEAKISKQDNTLSVNNLSINRHSNKDFATAGFDGLINIYDSSSINLTNSLKGHSKGVWCCNYSHSDNILASGSNDTKVMLWDTKTYKPTHTLSAHTDAIYDVKFSSSGKQLVSCSKGLLAVWDINNLKQPLKVIKDDENQFVYSVSFINNDKNLVCGHLQGNLMIFDVDDTSKVWKKELEPVRDISLTFDKTNATYAIFKPKTYEKDNTFFSSHTDGSIRGWEYVDNEAILKNIYPYSYEAVSCCNISPNGENIICGAKDHSAFAFNRKAINVIDFCLIGHRDIVTGIDFLTNDTVLSTSYDQTVKYWKLDGY